MRVKLRHSIVAALLLTTSTGVVLASSTACRVVVLEQYRAVQATMHRRVHHSAATLARWKIGAAAWSKTHGGKVYAGAPAPRHQDWTPLTFKCDDVALDLSRSDDGLLLPGEALPEFVAYEGRTPPSGIWLDLADAKPPLVEEAWEQALAVPFTPVPAGGGPGLGGRTPDGFLGPASFPPGPVPPLLASPIPAPESPTIVLLGTGMLSFLVSKLRRRTVV